MDPLSVQCETCFAPPGIHCECAGDQSVEEALRERVAALEDRQQELLETIRKLSSEIPYPEESGNAAILIAEVGTLRARVAELERERDGR